jgi:mRNA-degrading endonuclease HigB of HigAB toxin-antitoxin module
LEVNIISRPKLREMAQHYAPAAPWIEGWINRVASKQWTCLEDVRADYPSADHVCNCLIFNVCGNHYRLIVGIWWARSDDDGNPSNGAMFIKHLLPHSEYNKNKWRKDCGCDD